MFIPWEPKPTTILLTLVFDSVMILLGENHHHFSFLGWTSWPDVFTVGVGTIQLHRVDNRAPWAKSTSIQNGWTRFFRSQNFINKPFSVVCPCPSEFSTVPWLVFWAGLAYVFQNVVTAKTLQVRLPDVMRQICFGWLWQAHEYHIDIHWHYITLLFWCVALLPEMSETN